MRVGGGVAIIKGSIKTFLTISHRIYVSVWMEFMLARTASCNQVLSNGEFTVCLRILKAHLIGSSSEISLEHLQSLLQLPGALMKRLKPHLRSLRSSPESNDQNVYSKTIDPLQPPQPLLETLKNPLNAYLKPAENPLKLPETTLNPHTPRTLCDANENH